MTRQTAFAMVLALIAVLTTIVSAACAASPCDGVNRNRTKQRKTALTAVIAKQLQVPAVDVLESFRVGGWSVIYVDTHQSDQAFLFYSHDPLTNHYVILWGGATRRSEEQEIRDWTLKKAPGIPRQLADCFAWHVTKDPQFRE
ncbi:MAG: hypothetical protein ACYDDO_14585 [Acidiferrobacterales bacterium]